MNIFDRTQVDFLKPLLEHNVVLHFSFYANTFPIAYHYNILLEEFNTNFPSSKKTISDFIKPHNWNKVFPSETNSDFYGIRSAMGETNDWKHPESIHLFYTSDIDFKTQDFINDNPFNIISKTKAIVDGKEKIEPILFSEYIPRFVFLNNNLYTQNLIRPEKKEVFTIDSIEFKELTNIKNQYYSLTEVLEKAMCDKIETLRVYTETINEAKDIFEDYEEWKDKVVYYDGRKIDSLNLDDTSKNESKSLDIYFYGAPISFLFLNRKKRFLPVLLDKANIAIKTKAIVHSNSNEEKHKSEIIELIKNHVNQYHKNLYKVACSPQGEEFLNNIRLAYNKYARLTRNDSFFFTPQSFANCIALYHKYDEIEGLDSHYSARIKDEPQAINNNPHKNIHIHYGAGKLGIGLVLPLIKPNAESFNQLIVIQKGRKNSDWDKINSKTGFVELSNSQGWSLKLNFQKPNFIIEEKKDYFILFENLSEVKNILKNATSISYSLNDINAEKEFLEHLATIDFSKKVLLFPFENNPFGSQKADSDEYKLNNEIIFPNESKVKYIKVKADRICSDRIFNADNKVSVPCEEYVEVVLNISEDVNNSLFHEDFIKQKKIKFIEDKKIFSFLAKRKQFLVNELHFVLVVYGYEFLISKGITNWEQQFVTIIQSALISDYKYKIPIDTFIRLQIMRLLYLDEFKNNTSNNYDWSMLMTLFDLEEASGDLIYENLIKYSKVTTERFSASQEDLMTRVFNANSIDAIKRKYSDIIKEIVNFIDNNDNKNKIENIKISYAGTYLEYKYLIDDIKDKILKIFNEKKKHFDKQVELKQIELTEKGKELIGKQKELTVFVDTINKLIND